MADRTLKVGFIGCGRISRLYTDISQDCATLPRSWAVADVVPELAQSRTAAMSEAY